MVLGSRFTEELNWCGTGSVAGGSIAQVGVWLVIGLTVLISSCCSIGACEEAWMAEPDPEMNFMRL